MRRPRSITLLGLLLLPPIASAAKPIQALRAVEKPTRTLLNPHHDPGRVILKFQEGSGAHLRHGQFEGSFDAPPLATVLAAHGVRPGTDIKRLIDFPDPQLHAMRDRAREHLQREVASLTLYYQIRVAPGTDAAALCDDLNALGIVELAEPAPLPLPAPVDIPPTTPNLRGFQDYRASSPSGMGAKDVTTLPGADGTDVMVIDLEYAWNLDHEDLELPASINLETVFTPVNPFAGDDHGTAVLGILYGGANEYGITGFVPNAEIRVAPTNTGELGYNLPRAIVLAILAADAGDVILIEQQYCVCNNTCVVGQEGLGPSEWVLSVYDAIVIATGQGIHVVEAAGNGGVNLDTPACAGFFDRVTRPDSLAIVVGGGEPDTRARRSSSSHGSRVDVQAWGRLVTTTGYVDSVPGTTDPDQRYTGGFSGTSSASALVAGAVASIQGVLLARGLGAATPTDMRQLLVDTGLPQNPADPPDEHIGPLPDLVAALDELGDLTRQCADGVDNDLDGDTDDPADADCADTTDRTEFALQPDDLIVSDYDLGDFAAGGTGALLRVDPQGGDQTVLRRGGSFEDPSSVAVDSDGQLIVLEWAIPGVLRFDPATGDTEFITTGAPLESAWGLDFEVDESVVVSDSTANQIVRVNPMTGAQTVISSLGSLVSPRGVAVESTGTILVANQTTATVLRIDPSIPDDGLGGNQTVLSTGGLLSAPAGVALDAVAGQLYVGDRNNASVVRIDTSTGSQTLISSGNLLQGPDALALDAGGYVLVADSDAGLVIRVDPANGSQTAVSSGGEFVEPFGVVTLPEPNGLTLLATGVAFLLLLGRTRARSGTHRAVRSAGA